MFTKAIVRTPCHTMLSGISEADMGLPDYDLACEQHREYVLALKTCGLDVMELPALDAFPDSCFVEDVALITKHCAVLTQPGATSRRGEVKYIEQAVSTFYREIEEIYLSDGEAYVEAGDIMMVGDHFFVGLSDRTNKNGAAQMIGILNKYNLTGSVVDVADVLHLKTGVSYLEKNNLLVLGELNDHPDFSMFNKIKVDEDEAYAANCVWINGTVLVPKGFPKTLNAIKQLDYKTLELGMSEFQKLDGGLSCLSLRF